MAAIAAKDADSFVARPDPRRPIILVYGPDLGLVRERVDTLLKGAAGATADPFSTVSVDGDVLAGDPGRLADEARAIGLFGGRRLVHIRAGGRNFADALANLLDDPPPGALIVIEAGDLKKGAPLRKSVEGSQAGAAIPCYQDDARTVARLVETTLKEAGLTIDNDARDSLVDLLGADRLASRAELEKLVMYVGDKKRVEFSDVLAAIADSSALALDDVVDAAAAGDANEAMVSFAKTRAAGIPASVVIGAAIRHIAILHRMSLRVERGERPARIVAETQQRIFFRRQPFFERALNRFGPPEFERTLIALGTALLASRRSAQLADPIAEREILAIAKGARRRR